MIKQIQLRGISRTPSDRLSEDGGLSESLNMYLDTAESAPAIVPEDVTEKFGLPAELKAERVFIHKTINYENVIVVQNNSIFAYYKINDLTNQAKIFTLQDGESIIDMSSLGNTVILSSNRSIHYVLYENRKYSYLGSKIPFPYIHFQPSFIPGSREKEFYLDQWKLNNIPEESIWNSYYLEDKESQDVPLDYAQLSTSVYGTYLGDKNKAEQGEMVGMEYEKKFLTKAIVVRYAVEMYDGSYLSSVPILLSPFSGINTFRIETTVTETYGWKYYGEGEREEIIKDENRECNGVAQYDMNCAYTIKAVMNSMGEEIQKWKSLIKSIKIFVSLPVDTDPRHPEVSFIQDLEYQNSTSKRNETIDGVRYDTTTDTYKSSCVMIVGSKKDYSSESPVFEDILTSSAITYLYKTIIPTNEDGQVTEEFSNLLGGGIELDDLPKFIADTTQMRLKDRLEKDDMKHYLFAPTRTYTYNNGLLAVDASQYIAYDYDKLNAIGSQSITIPGVSYERTDYDIYYLIAADSSDKIVRKQFVSKYMQSAGTKESVFGLLFFPDSRASKVYVTATTYVKYSGDNREYLYKKSYGVFDMKPHPYLPCAYFNGGLEKELVSLCTLDAIKDLREDTLDDISDKLFQSATDDPFVFPISRAFTFDSKVIGVAIATTALSQGQFGQFPLYVFTEDGIWVMETAEDGSFVSRKPLSREVCINPDSICSIDNAVVFVTSKAVMMIQGSQVMNISPYMNGRHYVPNDSALNLIRNQEGFDTLIGPISDDDPFMAFMKDAKVAYDYTGQRLIFISPSNEGFQYVYKIDTKTWHKVAFDGLDLDAPLNSYPECLALGQAEEKELLVTPNIQYGAVDSELFIEHFIGVVYDTPLLENVDRDTVIGFITGHIYIRKDDFLDWDAMIRFLDSYDITYEFKTKEESNWTSRIFSLSTVLDASTTQDTAKGILITRPFDLGMPDVYKSITSIKIRGDFDKGNVKYILQGSDDGRTFYTLSSLRGKSWKMFRIFILADLEPTERISWIDIDFEPRYQNKLR